MDQVKSMAKKRERHYPETKSVVAILLMIIGTVALFTLIVVWPQKFAVDVFNSRLMYRLIIDVEDFLTCNDDYKAFVIDEPDSSYSMYTMYIFNISNPSLVIAAGNEPTVQETGPYGFVKSSFKYDIYFDPIDSLTVTFKEYTLLKEVEDPTDCEKMYYRTDRDQLSDTRCTGDSCWCKSLDDRVLIINPLYLKLLKEDRPESVFGHMAKIVYQEVKNILDVPFSDAVRAHLVTESMFEVYQFRLQMQVLLLMNTALDNLLNIFTLDQIADSQPAFPTSCGLSIYGIVAECPWELYFNVWLILKRRTDIAESEYPKMHVLLNASSPISLINADDGLPAWVGLAHHFGFADFNFGKGYTSVTSDEFEALADRFALALSEETFGVGNVTDTQLIASRRMVSSISSFLGTKWIVPYAFADLRLTSLVAKEFETTYKDVPCSPLGDRCVYQWGYMRHNFMNYTMSSDLSYSLIDLSSRVDSNPNNLFKDRNSASWYNSFLYCTKVRQPVYDDIDCTNYEVTLDQGMYGKPSGMWAIDSGLGLANVSFAKLEYKKQSTTTRLYFEDLACNISNLVYGVFAKNTSFHDKFVVKYLQKYKDPDLNHNFTDNWTELGVIQWAGGYITESIANVRSVNMIKRDGMWVIGSDDYWDSLFEYSSWSVKQGYPHAFINNFADANKLLNSLADVSYSGYEFRKHIVYRGTTLIGDGRSFFNNVGGLGEVAFTPEYILGNFSCTGVHEGSCDLLDTYFASSSAQCSVIQSFYTTCTDEYLFQDNGWIDFDKCAVFETSLSSSTQGIQCNDGFIYGNAHPYTKSRGNIMFEYLRVLTLNLVFKDGLWCTNYNTCSFANGGLFLTTSPRKLLFDGISDPFLLRFLHLKHEFDNVSYECVNEPYDKCGKQNFDCDNAGIMMYLPRGDNITIHRDAMKVDNFFAPYYEMTVDGELIWKYSQDPEVREYAYNVSEVSETVIIRNLFWAAFPAWNTNDTDFNKFYQCQKRLYFGVPNQFSSCEETLYTGRDKFAQTLNLQVFRGNETIFLVENSSAIRVSGSTQMNRYTMYRWGGFKSYPYLYNGLSGGEEYGAMKNPLIFHRQHNLPLSLSQDSLIFAYERNQKQSIPYGDTSDFEKESGFPKVAVEIRVFVEDDATWEYLENMGTNQDTYGMPYLTPVGMASLERSVGLPMFTGTPHFYGNKLWGGREYSLLAGLKDNQYSQRTFIDYDPVTGRATRQVVRQQLQFRITSNAINPVLISSQSRCITPTKVYLGGTGYGCFTYVPLLWYEDIRLMNGEEVFQLEDHYYTRPGKKEEDD